MANLNAPFGFRFYRSLVGEGPQVRHYTVTASTNIYEGMPVKLHQTTGNLIAMVGTFTLDDDTAGSMVGIAAATQLSTAAVTPDFPVILARDAEFIVQDDGGGTVTSLATYEALFYNDVYFSINDISATHASNGLGQSIASLAVATSHATAEYLKVVDYVRTADNAFGDYMKHVVRFNPALFQAGPYPVSVVA